MFKQVENKYLERFLKEKLEGFYINPEKTVEITITSFKRTKKVNIILSKS